jgi:phosphatidylserine/phosphatidylglycerophosphate/cardiolipin synthase-like enzyme
VSAARHRIIHSRASAKQVPDLLQMLFLSELLAPSRCIWLVSPWITDIPVIDNRSNGFLAFESSWVRSGIRLSQVLGRLLDLGTTVHVATRPVEHNAAFIDRLKRLVEADRPPLEVHTAEELHEKGILGDTYYLSGSMNFTYNGISLNEEAVQYTTEPAFVAHNRVLFAQRWGGELR